MVAFLKGFLYIVPLEFTFFAFCVCVSGVVFSAGFLPRFAFGFCSGFGGFSGSFSVEFSLSYSVGFGIAFLGVFGGFSVE